MHGTANVVKDVDVLCLLALARSDGLRQSSPEVPFVVRILPRQEFKTILCRRLHFTSPQSILNRFQFDLPNLIWAYPIHPVALSSAT